MVWVIQGMFCGIHNLEALMQHLVKGKIGWW
jgi:hypothetical protein